MAKAGEGKHVFGPTATRVAKESKWAENLCLCHEVTYAPPTKPPDTLSVIRCTHNDLFYDMTSADYVGFYNEVIKRVKHDMLLIRLPIGLFLTFRQAEITKAWPAIIDPLNSKRLLVGAMVELPDGLCSSL